MGMPGRSRSFNPRAAPGVSSSAPFFASACRWSSAELAVEKPNPDAISARVGGMPVASMCPRIQSRICCWRAVRRGDSGAAPGFGWTGRGDMRWPYGYAVPSL